MDKPTKDDVIKKSEEVLDKVKASTLPTWAKYTITALIGAGVAVVCTFCLSSCTISPDTANAIRHIAPYILKVEK